jgi:hypothetical protein
VGSRITRRPWDRAGPLTTRFPTFPSGPQRSLCVDLEGGPLGTPRPAPDGILEVSPSNAPPGPQGVAPGRVRAPEDGAFGQGYPW